MASNAPGDGFLQLRGAHGEGHHMVIADPVSQGSVLSLGNLGLRRLLHGGVVAWEQASPLGSGSETQTEPLLPDDPSTHARARACVSARPSKRLGERRAWIVVQLLGPQRGSLGRASLEPCSAFSPALPKPGVLGLPAACRCTVCTGLPESAGRLRCGPLRTVCFICCLGRDFSWIYRDLKMPKMGLGI